MALSASVALVISTKPNPRERPVSRSVTSVIFSTAHMLRREMECEINLERFWGTQSQRVFAPGLLRN